MNGNANCLLEVCCPPNFAALEAVNGAATASDHAVAAMASELRAHCGLSPDDAHAVAQWIYTHFDLAERGTLQAFKASIVRVYNSR